MGRFSEITFQDSTPITGTVNSDTFDIRNNKTWAVQTSWAAPAAAKTFDSGATETATITFPALSGPWPLTLQVLRRLPLLERSG